MWGWDTGQTMSASDRTMRYLVAAISVILLFISTAVPLAIIVMLGQPGGPHGPASKFAQKYGEKLIEVSLAVELPVLVIAPLAVGC